MRIAAFDIGTNSIHMLVAEVRANGTFKVLEREKDLTRLGDGSFEKRMLQKPAMRRALKVIDRFRRMAEEYDVQRMFGVATSAVRDARNGHAFVREIRRATGVNIRVISGREEGRLIEIAARSNSRVSGKRTLVVDLGGGSLELIVGNGKKHDYNESFPLGAARLTDHFLRKDPPSRKELWKLERHVERTLAEAERKIDRVKISSVIGTAGTLINLASMVYESETSKELKLKRHFPLERWELEKVHSKLVSLSLKKRLSFPGLDSKRADIIVAGSLVIRTLMRLLDIERIHVSKRGIREGMILDFIAKNRRSLAKKKW